MEGRGYSGFVRHVKDYLKLSLSASEMFLHFCLVSYKKEYSWRMPLTVHDCSG